MGWISSNTSKGIKKASGFQVTKLPSTLEHALCAKIWAIQFQNPCKNYAKINKTKTESTSLINKPTFKLDIIP